MKTEVDPPLSSRGAGYAPTVTPDVLNSQVDLESPTTLDEGRFPDRYTTGELLGEGGMGEVRLIKDGRIGREVAMKVIRPGHGSRSDLRSRFLREARVQGQLEHPAIVPVYDLGVDPSGASYFTMKRVRGMTLEEVLDGLRSRNPEATIEYSRRKLLTAFGSVWLAIDFAHARGVIHRDLKPGNIMLGGFGEVYVLDWGVAKLGQVPEPETVSLVHAPLTAGGDTAVGAVLGTPGYMPPEQMLGGHLDARSDVYALGAILFEILTLQLLHPQTNVSEMIASTLGGANPSAARAPEREIPPELEAICARATATNPDDRFASARELNVALERFLDGDRDLERRQAMAATHAETAMIAAERALGDLKGGAESRREAMRELGRSLALDARNPDALRTMVRLIAEPPDDIPPEAQAEVDEAKAEGVKVQARAAAWAYASWFIYFPIMYQMGIVDWVPTIASGALMVVAIGLTIASGRSAKILPLRLAFLGLACASLASAFSSRMFGPFIVVPTVVLATVVGFSMHHVRKHRIPAVILGLSAIVGPTVLEWASVLPRSYAFRDGVMIVVPHMVTLREGPTLTFLLVGNVMAVVTTLMYVGWTRDQVERLERRAQIQSWHFRQLAPDDARAALKRPTVPPPRCAVKPT